MFRFFKVGCIYRHGVILPKEIIMKVTVRQLKALIREAATEAMEEMDGHDGADPSLEETLAQEQEEALNEAVTRAFRAGYQRGLRAARSRR